jgi:hypothetical protein
VRWELVVLGMGIFELGEASSEQLILFILVPASVNNRAISALDYLIEQALEIRVTREETCLAPATELGHV